MKLSAAKLTATGKYNGKHLMIEFQVTKYNFRFFQLLCMRFRPTRIDGQKYILVHMEYRFNKAVGEPSDIFKI